MLFLDLVNYVFFGGFMLCRFLFICNKFYRGIGISILGFFNFLSISFFVVNYRGFDSRNKILRIVFLVNFFW